MIKYLKLKYLLKILWFGFGLAGVILVGKQYFPNLAPNLKNSNLVKGVQTELVETIQTGDSSQPITLEDIKQLDPATASEVIGEIVKKEVARILEETTQEVKEFPQKQVRKIKIGACEELLEEDICSVAEEINCSTAE